jgi:hypothetical protein
MKKEDHEAKPAYYFQRTANDSTGVWRWAQELVRLYARLAPRFARAESRRRMLAYLQGILSGTSKKNGWQLIG